MSKIILWSVICIFLTSGRIRQKNTNLLDIGKFNQSKAKKIYCKMVFEWEYPNIKHLRPVWPQIASKFKVRFQFRVGQICHLSEKCELCFIGLLFTIFKIIVGKPTKFPFDHRITCLCGIHTALNMIYNRSVMIFSPHPVYIYNVHRTFP